MVADERDELLLKAINESIEIHEYDPEWPRRFELERQRLEKLFPSTFIGLEHVGSTAVPGLPAKPIIDIVGCVASMSEADRLLPLLCADGYTTSAEFNATLGDRRWLMRHHNGRRTHHLHLVLPTSEDWSDKIRFRDILRADSVMRDAYVALKRRLAGAIGSDREAYTDAKGEFVRAALGHEVK